MSAHVVRRFLALASAVLVGALATPAWAQRPFGTPPGLLKHGSKSSTGGSGKGPGGSTSAAAEGIGGAPPGGGPTARVRSLGVWLDDATLMGRGETWLTISAQHWASPSGSGDDAPIVDITGGIGHQMQAFVSVPYSRVTYTDSPTADELGTMYLAAKYVFREPSDRVIGFSITPALEILSDSAVAGTGLSRVNLVLPASAEWRRHDTRVYGSTGFFTRGAFFLGGAIEQTVSESWVVTGALTQSWSTSNNELNDALGLRSNRTDVSGSLSWSASPHVMVFGSLAHTLSPLDADSTRYSVMAGISLNLQGPGRRTPVAKP